MMGVGGYESGLSCSCLTWWVLAYLPILFLSSFSHTPSSGYCPWGCGCQLSRPALFQIKIISYNGWLTTNKNFPPGFKTLLKRNTASGWLGTQCRQEKELTMEKEEELEEMKDFPSETSNCWKERFVAWCVFVQWLIMSSDISTPTTWERTNILHQL